MKRILLSTALILAAGSGLAMTPHSLTGAARAQAEHLVPNGNFDNLTPAQVNAIEAILSGDESQRGGQIRAILN